MPARRTKVPKSLVTGPSEMELRQLLGRRYRLFDEVAHRTPGATGEWRCYKKGAPPVLKVIDGKRTLYYVRPERNSVHVTFLVTRRASDAALATPLPRHLRAALQSAQEFPEGRVVRLELHRLADVADVGALLAIKFAQTRSAAVPRARA